MQYALSSDKIDSLLLHSVNTREKKCTRVIFHDGCRKCRERLALLGCPIRRELPLINGFCAEVLPEWLPYLAAGTQVRYVEADMRLSTQMNIAGETIGARLANTSGYNGAGVTIAFADTGIYPHADFLMPNRIVRFVDFVGALKKPYDDNGHGTFVAGVAAGSGRASDGKYAGVAPGANLIMIKTMDAAGGGNASDLLMAMQWVLDNHTKYNIRVMSLSLGAMGQPKLQEDAMIKGVEALWKEGVFVVAAAGNSGPKTGTVTTPGVAACVLTVGAADDMRTVPPEDDKVANFSSRGNPGQKKPELLAPGVGINGTKADLMDPIGRKTGREYITMSGTSVATPIVAGCAALILQRYPEWQPAQVKEVLMEKTFELIGDEEAVGKGEVDVGKALDLR